MRLGSVSVILASLSFLATACGGGGRQGRDYGSEDEDLVTIDPGPTDLRGDRYDAAGKDVPDASPVLDPGVDPGEPDAADLPDPDPGPDTGLDDTPLLDSGDDRLDDPGSPDTFDTGVDPGTAPESVDAPETVSKCDPPRPSGCACETGDECASGACDIVEGTKVCVIPCDPPDCDDGVSCTKDDCLLLFGTCVHPPDDTACNDLNPCTQDACDPATGCLFVPGSGKPCVDGDPCTAGDVCTAGVCAGVALAGCCKVDADCDDSNACTEDACKADTGEDRKSVV